MEYIEVLDGIARRTLVYADKTLMAEFQLEKGRQLPMHAHPHEQTGVLISGHIVLTIGSEVHDMQPGDAWAIAGGLTHGAEVIEDSVAIEVFSPVREDCIMQPGKRQTISKRPK